MGTPARVTVYVINRCAYAIHSYSATSRRTGVHVATAGGERARTADLLWGPRERPSRGPKPGLTRDGIVRAAIGVADAEGLAAVSMQRVAAEVGFTTMALYRYVPGKNELVALMVDSAVGP